MDSSLKTILSSLESAVRVYIRFVETHRKRIILGFTLLTAFCLIRAIHMYAHLVTDLDELLPRSIRSVVDLKTVSKHMSSLGYLSVVFESQDTQTMKSFADELATAISTSPIPEIGDIIHKLSAEEKSFFRKNALLFLEVDELKRIHQFAQDRLRWERKQKSSLFLNLQDSADPPPTYDLKSARTKATALFLEHDGYFISPNHHNLIMLVYMADVTTNVDSALALTRHVSSNVNHLSSRYPTVTVGYSGEVQNLVEEHQAVMKDLITSGILVLVLVLIIIYLYFLSFRALILITLSLLSGTIIAFGISHFFVDHLNANTAFLGAIVFGNGINYSIMFMARFLEEHGKKKSIQTALKLGMLGSLKATLTASLAAGCAYGALMITDFRGFNQFGIIGFIGMICNWVAAYSLLPALCFMTSFGTYAPPKRRLGQWFAAGLKRFSTPISIFSFGLIIISILSLFRFDMDIIESNFANLRSRYSKEKGSGFWTTKVDDTFQRYLTPTLILTSSPSEAQWLARNMQHTIEQIPPGKRTIESVQSIYDLLPQQQPEKIELIRTIQKLLTPKVRSHLDDETRHWVETYIPQDPLTPVALADFPSKLLKPFRAKDGSLGRLILAYPTLETALSWDGKVVLNFSRQIREAVANTGRHFPISSQIMISSDIIGSITQDGPKATFLAFIIVLLLVIFVLRDWRSIFTIITSLLLGVLFLLAIISLWDLKINFLNFIALPITFGIGVDYAVNLFQRVKYDGWQHLQTAIAETGGAIVLCSLTTILGYGSLLIADNQGFVSFGILAVVGEITCLVSALVILPCLHFEFQKGFLASPKERS